MAPAPTEGVTISGYRVMYRAESSSSTQTMDSTETTITITGETRLPAILKVLTHNSLSLSLSLLSGLATGVEYSVQVAALSENSDLGVYSSAISVTPMNCLSKPLA